MLFRQLFDLKSHTYTYLLADEDTASAVLIDPVLDQFERDLRFIRDLQLDLKFVLETHIHADHVTAGGRLRAFTGCQILAGEGTKLQCADRLLKDGDELSLGSLRGKAIATPGHTPGCTSYFFGDRVFTGDTLLIRGCGRTDFQGGSTEQLFHSVREKLFRLADDVLVFPAHDYKGCNCSSIGEEKKYNPRLALEKSYPDFKHIMDNLKLGPPQQIEEAVPRNLQCGL